MWAAMAQYIPVIIDSDYGTPWNLLLRISLAKFEKNTPSIPLEDSALDVHG